MVSWVESWSKKGALVGNYVKFCGLVITSVNFSVLMTCNIWKGSFSSSFKVNNLKTKQEASIRYLQSRIFSFKNNNTLRDIIKRKCKLIFLKKKKEVQKHSENYVFCIISFMSAARFLLRYLRTSDHFRFCNTRKTPLIFSS